MATSKDWEPLLAVVAGLWAAVAVSISGTEMANQRKDVVISGCLDGRPITLSHRTSILYDDWIGAAAGNAIVAILFAYLLVLLCSGLAPRYQIFSRLCAVAALIYAGSWALTGFHDFTAMKQLLEAPGTDDLARRLCG